MDRTFYRFDSSWTVAAEQLVVFDVLADLGSYPQWWPQVREVREVGERTAELDCRSALPYRLRVRATSLREDRAAGVLEAALGGDLDGWSRWTLTPAPVGTALRYEQEVVTRTALLRRAAGMARPVLRLNHSWMMRGARRGLALRVQCGPHDRRP
ncbi:MAG: SRPBCC family protein [Nocardioidaceae bacterium]